MDHRPRVMVVANEAHRTGAPLVAIETLRALHDYDRVAVVKRGSDLLDRFQWSSEHIVHEPTGWLERWIPRFRMRGLPTGTRTIERQAARTVLRRFSPDLVYTHTVETGEYIVAAQEAGVPTVLHLHEPGDRVREFLGPFGFGVERPPPDLVVGCAEAISRDAAQAFGLSATEVRTVPEPVDVDAVLSAAEQPIDGPAPETPYVITVGSVNEVKGVDLWLDAVGEVARSRPQLRFYWVGAGPRLEWARREVQRLRLDRRVWFVGPRANPMPWIAGSEAFLLASRFEGMPLVLLEALTLGVPCVAFAVQGVPDAIGDHGIVVPPEDVSGLASAIESALSDVNLRARVRFEGPVRMRRESDVTRFHRSTRDIVESLTASSR